MKQTEEGILLRRSNYSETSLLVTCLTYERGLQTYLFQGGKKKHGNILFPMAHLELTTFQRADSTLGKISAVELKSGGHEIVFDPVKSSIAFYTAELLLEIVKPAHQEKYLFRFLEEETQWIAHSSHLANYPLWLTAELTKISGIQPAIESDSPNVLDLSGKLRAASNDYPGIQHESLHWLHDAFTRNKQEFLALPIPRNERMICLQALLAYLKEHFAGMRELKSLKIVQELFN